MTIQYCVLCGKRTMPPNEVLSKNQPYHIGCAMDELHRLEARYKILVDKLFVEGKYGPWCDEPDSFYLQWDDKDFRYSGEGSIKEWAKEKVTP